MKRYVFLFLILGSLCFTGCKSRPKYMAGTPSPRELSARLGVHVTESDYRYLYSEGAEWLGVPHRTGGTSKRGVDCSGFVGVMYRKVYGRKLCRSSADILKNDCRRIGKGSLQEGDLVFFRTGKGRKKVPNHVGIYLKSGKFIHASSSRGVTVSSLSEPYYVRAWLTGGRVRK